MKSAEELIKIIKENIFQKGLFNLDDIGEYLYNEETDDEGFDTNELALEYLAKFGLANLKSMEYVSNTDEMYCVIHFTDDNVYLKLTGEYDSYGQYEHDYNGEIYQVFPKEVFVTQYLTL